MGGTVGYNNCPVCGKLFYVSTADWVYKRIIKRNHAYQSSDYYCSWKCFRAVELEEERKREDRKRKAIERRTKSLNATLHQRRMDRSKSDRT